MMKSLNNFYSNFESCQPGILPDLRSDPLIPRIPSTHFYIAFYRTFSAGNPASLCLRGPQTGTCANIVLQNQMYI